MTTKSVSLLGILCVAVSLPAADDYQPGPDSRPQEGVPKGEVIKGEFDQSKVFPATWREYWIYKPHNYDASRPSPVMIFQEIGRASCRERV